MEAFNSQVRMPGASAVSRSLPPSRFCRRWCQVSRRSKEIRSRVAKDDAMMQGFNEVMTLCPASLHRDSMKCDRESFELHQSINATQRNRGVRETKLKACQWKQQKIHLAEQPSSIPYGPRQFIPNSIST